MTGTTTPKSVSRRNRAITATLASAGLKTITTNLIPRNVPAVVAKGRGDCFVTTDSYSVATVLHAQLGGYLQVGAPQYREHRWDISLRDVVFTNNELRSLSKGYGIDGSAFDAFGRTASEIALQNADAYLHTFETHENQRVVIRHDLRISARLIIHPDFGTSLASVNRYFMDSAEKHTRYCDFIQSENGIYILPLNDENVSKGRINEYEDVLSMAAPVYGPDGRILDKGDSGEWELVTDGDGSDPDYWEEPEDWDKVIPGWCDPLEAGTSVAAHLYLIYRGEPCLFY